MFVIVSGVDFETDLIRSKSVKYKKHVKMFGSLVINVLGSLKKS